MMHLVAKRFLKVRFLQPAPFSKISRREFVPNKVHYNPECLSCSNLISPHFHNSLNHKNNDLAITDDTPITEKEILLRQANALEKERKFMEAEKIYNKIIYEVDPKDVRTYNLLIQLWRRMGIFVYAGGERVDKLLSQYEKHFS